MRSVDDFEDVVRAARAIVGTRPKKAGRPQPTAKPRSRQPKVARRSRSRSAR